jgi:peptidoglycan/xylan/chitin deacetylase (PgdA/CDA1 family)
MRLVSPLLKRVVYPTAQRIGWFNRIMPSAGYGVVNYHGVVPNDHIPRDHTDAEPFLDGNLVQPEVFRKQLRFLKAHYCVIHPEEFREWIEHGKPLPERAVLITCDDGLLNTLTDMLPILQGEDVSCLFFVTAASCGDAPGMLWYEELYQMMRAESISDDDLQLPREEVAAEDSAGRNAPENFQARWWSVVRRASRLDTGSRADWMQRLRSQGQARNSVNYPAAGKSPVGKTFSEKRWRLLNVSELRRLADAGMSIGAHTISHPILSLCNEAEARREIQEGKTLLARILGREVWAFAYPFGNPATMGEREVSLARDAGFACGFLNVEHWDGLRSDFLALPRTHVSMSTTLPEFAAHLSGLHARLQRAMGG